MLLNGVLVETADANADAGLNATRRRTKHDFEYSDTDKDGKLSLAEYVAELLPGSFHGNETVAEVEASPVWKEQEQDWVVNSKVWHIHDAQLAEARTSIC